jgi:hypothetical protein
MSRYYVVLATRTTRKEIKRGWVVEREHRGDKNCAAIKDVLTPKGLVKYFRWRC